MPAPPSCSIDALLLTPVCANVAAMRYAMQGWPTVSDAARAAAENTAFMICS